MRSGCRMPRRSVDGIVGRFTQIRVGPFLLLSPHGAHVSSAPAAIATGPLCGSPEKWMIKVWEEVQGGWWFAGISVPSAFLMSCFVHHPLWSFP